MHRNVSRVVRRLLSLALAALLLGAALTGCSHNNDLDEPGTNAEDTIKAGPQETESPSKTDEPIAEPTPEPTEAPTPEPTTTPQPEPFIPIPDLPSAVLLDGEEDDLPVFSLGDRRYIAVNRYDGHIGVGSTLYVQDMANNDTRLFAEINGMGAVQDIFLAGDRVLVFGWALDAAWPFPSTMCWMVFDANTAEVIRDVEATDIITKDLAVGTVNSIAISDGRAMYYGKHTLDPGTFTYTENEYYRMDASLEPELMFTSDRYYEFAFVYDGWLYMTNNTATQDLPAPLEYAARYDPETGTLEELETPPAIDPYAAEYPPPPYPIDIYEENGQLQVEYYDEAAAMAAGF